MILPKEPEIGEKSFDELEGMTYGKTRISLLNINGNYQIRKENKQGVVIDIIDYDGLGNFLEGVYNLEIEDAFERIKQAKSHINQFVEEKSTFFLKIESASDLEGLSERKQDYLGGPVTSVSGKPMVFHIFRSEEFRSDLDFLTIDETV